MDVLLTIFSGPSSDSVLVVTPGECVTFGRTTASQRSFPNDTHMSSQHFEIENHDSWAEVRDKKSTNGTWVNNNRVASERLNEGDQLRAGTTIFSVHFQNTTPSPRRVSPVSADTLGPNQVGQPPVDLDPVSLVRKPTGPEFAVLSKPISSSSGSMPSQSPSQRPIEDDSGNPSSSGDVFHGSRVPRATGLGLASNESGGGLLEDIHKHLDKRLTPFADSIDLSELIKEKHRPMSPVSVPIESAIAPEAKMSPLSDSSMFPTGVPESVPSKVQPAGGYEFMSKRFAVPLAQGLEAVVESLSRDWSVQIVVHPQKIRQGIPHSCSSVQFLWSCYGEASQYGPVTIPWIDFRHTLLPFVERLCNADSMVVFFGNDLNAMAARLQQLSLAEIQGFSEKGGFLSCFWPSSLATILSARGPTVCYELFQEDLCGLLMPSPWDRQVMTAAVGSKFGQALIELGFSRASDIGQLK